MVLLQYKIESIRKLIEQGVSTRETARRVGVSRGSVFRVIRGIHSKYAPRKRDLKLNERIPEDKEHLPGEVFFCKKCRARVLAPCVSCFIRSISGRLPTVPRLPGISGKITLDLKGKDYERYLAIRARKERCEEEYGPDSDLAENC